MSYIVYYIICGIWMDYDIYAIGCLMKFAWWYLTFKYIQNENVNKNDKVTTPPNDICLFVNRSLTDKEKIEVRINVVFFLLF